MEIKPIFETTLAEDATTAWGSHHKKGTRIVFQDVIVSKKLETFNITPPNPVNIYLDAAEKHADRAKQIENELIARKEYLVYSHLNNSQNATAENSLKNDPNAQKIRQHDKTKLYTYLEEAMGSIIHMVIAIETLVNMCIPIDYKIIERKFVFIKKVRDKKYIERFFSLERKIEIISQLRGLKDIKQQQFWGDFKVLKRMRDNFIHPKTNGQPIGIGKAYTKVYASLIDIDLKQHLNSILSLAKFIDPRY